ncbi:hypothetical protein GCM10023189_33330 [Nibrella saemangeumensis]|uniref:Prevent-host-death protein n=1 Tax=Nibrella saemangeumensis TaxID=1084526 RepID=A0ABP8N3N9_9BACT
MKTMTVGDLKARFSEVIQEVKAGEEIAVTFGKKKEIVAYLVPKSTRKPAKRQLGLLKDKGNVLFTDDFKITEEEFLGL